MTLGWSSSRRAHLMAATLGVHVIALWLMLGSRLSVERQPDHEQEAWVEIHPAAATVAAMPSKQAPALTAPPTRRIAVPTIAIPPVAIDQTSEGATLAPSRSSSGAGPARSPDPPLDLRLPQRPNEQATPLTPAQEAMRDPRSNTFRLTRNERLQLTFGQVECIAWQRMPDGSIYRGTGHLRPSLDVPPRPDGTRVMECVR